MKILVLNSGSSSLKYQVIDMSNEKTVAEGICERIGTADSEMTYKAHGNKTKVEHGMPTHKEAIDLVLKTLQGENGVIKSIEEIEYILKISTNFIFRKTLYISTDKVIDSLISKELKMIKPNIFQYKDMKIVFKNFV